jgi:hypothetical protein
MKKYQIVIFLLLLSLSVLFSGCVTSSDGGGPTQTPVPEPQTQVPTMTPPPTTSTPVPTPVVPPEVDIFEPLIVDYDSNVFEIKLKDYERGSYANEQIAKASRYNPAPSENFEFILLEVSTRCIKGDNLVYISQGDFAVYIGNKKVAAWTENVVLPSAIERFDDAYMENGDSEIGWMVFEVPKDKDLRLAFEPEIKPLGFINI